jgi:hypothetical protein
MSTAAMTTQVNQAAAWGGIVLGVAHFTNFVLFLLSGT